MEMVSKELLAILDQHIPCYLIVDGSNTIVKSGSALARFLLEQVEGRCLTEVFTVHGAIDGGNPASREAGRPNTKLRAKDRGIAFEGVRWNLAEAGIWLLSPSTSDDVGNLSVEDFPRLPGNASYFLQTQFQKLLMLELNEVAFLEREQRLRADGLLEDMSVIVAITSHDICNYMQIVSGTLDEIVLDEAEAGFRSSILAAREACDLATTLLHSMLSVSGHPREFLSRFSVGVTISELAGLLESIMPTKVELEIAISCQRVDVFGERGGFIASLLNLVKNASEAFGEKCGKIVISTHLSPKYTNRVLIKVSDTGPGLPLASIDSQNNNLFTSKRCGSGLGLASVRKFCERSGWTMEIESLTGRGTCILLSAPIADTMSSMGGGVPMHL